MQEPIVKYIEMVVPTWPCNFRCHYCYVGQHMEDLERVVIEPFQHTPQELAEMLSVKKLGGRAVVNFCAHGETLLPPQNLAYIKAILQAGHYVMVVSNMTITKPLEELLQLPPEMVSRLFFKASFHWLELKKEKLLKTFTSNVNKVWQKGASITVEITPSDELELHIEEIKQYSLEHFGALPHITVPRDENDNYKILTRHSPQDFAKIWGTFHSSLFDFKMAVWSKKIKKFCYAGFYAYSINMASGDVFRCSSCGKIGNLFDEPNVLPQDPAGYKCPFPHCYNGHSWLAFGCVPDLRTPTYALMRDRTRTDGTHWLHPAWQQAFTFRAFQANPQYGFWRKVYASFRFRRKGRHSLWWHIKNWNF